MPLQLRAVGEGVAAVRAAVVVVAGLVAVLDVLLQRGVALVAPGAVGASVQLGEGVRGACGWRGTRRVALNQAAPGKPRKSERAVSVCAYGYRFRRRPPSPLDSARPAGREGR